MKKILFSLFFIFAMLGLRAQNGFWEEAKAPFGGTLNITKTVNGRLYSTYTPEHVYRSDDGGQNWERLPDLGASFPDSLLKSVSIGNGGAILMDLNIPGNRWQVSHDEGQSWKELESGINNLLETANGVLISVKANNICRSVDGGETWSVSLNATGYIEIMQDGTVFVNGNQTIYLSQDDGASWSSQPYPSVLPTGWYFTPSGAILGEYYSKLYRSVDGGLSFTPLPVEGLFGPSYSTLNSGRILLQSNQCGNVCEEGNLLYSDDDGLTWQILTTPQEGAGGYLAKNATLADGTIFKYYLDALLRSNDGGLTWQFSGNGITFPNIEDMKFVSDSLYYALTRIGLWKTEDAGEHWNLLTYNILDNKFYGKNFAISPAGGVAVFQNNKLLWSSDFGETFTDITPAEGLPATLQHVFLNPIDNTLFVNYEASPSDYGIKKSNNFGQTWTVALANNKAHNMAFHPSGRIIANCQTNVLVSDNSGDSWSAVPNPAGWGESGPITIVAPNGTIYLSRKDRSLWRSKDIGETWAKLPNVLQNGFNNGESMCIATNGHLYTTNGLPEVKLSIDEGYNWQTLPPAFKNGYPFHIDLSPNQTLFAECAVGLLYQSSSPVTQGAYIEGHVRIDADADCSTDDAQAPLNNRKVEASSDNLEYFTQTDAAGHYVFFVDTGAYEVKVQNPNGIWWSYCDTSKQVELPNFFVADTADFAAIPLSFCPLMTVNVGILFLRPCFDNEVYVEFCNQGTELADSAWVDIMLDPYLTFVSSAQSNIALPNNTVRFFVGDVPSGECGQFQLTVNLDCDSAIVGQTHCVTAHGFPDTLCTTVPNWSGANIEASVTCQDSILQFNLKNTGTAHSQVLDYIIIEDEVVLMTGQQDYNIAEDVILDVPANGRTWRIESEQEPGHPFSNLALAFAEGCGGFNSLGYINQFPVNGIQPSWHRMCVESTASCDPNDKQGFPTGTGSEHNIRPGQTIDYLIRFQNTGTDTAFTVVVRDTLSAFLDPLSIRPGASSHPYTWALSGQGVITFSFNNIMLPDSNINEQNSHGFVQFSIAPYADVPLGSVIENSAAIYFDFNQPVITNTTWHTIQKSPLSSALRPEPKLASAGLEVWPNPFNERTNIRLDKEMNGTLLLKIFDSRGTLVAKKSAIGPNIELSAKHLLPGFYWAEVRDSQGKLVGNGKMVKE